MRTPSKLWVTAALALPLLLSACSSGATANQSPASAPAVSQNVAPEAPATAAPSSVFVPDVIGLPADDVERVLRQLQLRVKWDKKVSKTSDWIVTEASPKVGEALNHGSIVTLKLTKASAYKDPDYIEGAGADDPSDVVKQYSQPEASSSADPSSSPTGATPATGTGTGSTVSCVDGTVSTAGGQFGACSGHGGVAG